KYTKCPCVAVITTVTLVPVTGNVVTHRTWASNIFVVTPPLGGVHRIRCVTILGPWSSIPSIQSCCTHRIRQ
ncbi:hypothetical protein EDB89DRAFT_1992264, partial [Lactarius sanguifluus]